MYEVGDFLVKDGQLWYIESCCEEEYYLLYGANFSKGTYYYEDQLESDFHRDFSRVTQVLDSKILDYIDQSIVNNQNKIRTLKRLRWSK